MRVCACVCPIQVGKAAFQRNNDPLDAALFYLAMKKKAVLWGLFRYRLSLLFTCMQTPLYNISMVKI